MRSPRLLHCSQVPPEYQERGIVSGYREPGSSAAACLRSAFRMSNETINIWTHFVPAWFFAWQLAAAPRGPWPFPAFLLSCCLYPLASSGAHTFGAMSGRARHLGYCLDYAALGTYSLGSALAYSAFAFPPEWLRGPFHRCYVPLAALHAPLATALACYSRFLEPARPRLGKALRTLAFAYPYLFDSIPIFYRLGTCGARGCAAPALVLHGRHTALALLAGLVFASRLPERLAPGRFDRLGHSHQLFHVCGILGTHFQVEAVRMDMAERHGTLPDAALPTALGTFIPMGIGTGASLAIAALCSASLGRVSLPSRPRKLY